VGKTGPVFDFKKKSAFSNDRNLKKLTILELNNNKINEEKREREREEQEILLDSVKDPFSSFARSDGFSFGMKTNKNLGFRKIRKEEYNKNKEKTGFRDFVFDNILKYNEKYNYNYNNETQYQYNIKDVKLGISSLSDDKLKERIKTSKIEIIEKNFSKTQKRFFKFKKK
jgi:hypothetical protein